MEFIVIVHGRAVAALGAVNLIALTLHGKFATAFWAFIAKVFQAVANPAVCFPLNLVFFTPSVFVDTELFVNDIVHFFNG